VVAIGGIDYSPRLGSQRLCPGIPSTPQTVDGGWRVLCVADLFPIRAPRWRNFALGRTWQLQGAGKRYAAIGIGTVQSLPLLLATGRQKSSNKPAFQWLETKEILPRNDEETQLRLQSVGTVTRCGPNDRPFIARPSHTERSSAEQAAIREPGTEAL
jgi:hypothetical protein